MDIPATINSLDRASYATCLSLDSASVVMVEHVLAALISLGIDNAVVELDGPEVPIMDGSAAPFACLIKKAGLKRLISPRRYLKILRPISLSDGNKRIAVHPSDGFKITYSVDFSHPLLMRQLRELWIWDESFIKEIAPARTFGYLRDVEMLRTSGLAKGEADILFDGKPRYPDEFVRHKVLDLIGDLALLGFPIIGNIVAHQCGHTLNTALVAKIMGNTDAWRLVEMDNVTGQVLSSHLKSVEIMSVSPQLLQLLKQDIGHIYNLSPDMFEQLVCERMDRMGFYVQRVGSIYTPDGGVDIIAWPKKTSFPFLLAIQAKHHRSPNRKTGPTDVKNFSSTINRGPFQAGMLITSTTFTPSAKWFANYRPHLIRLRDIHDLSRWIADEFIDNEDWREIPSKIELAPGVIIDLPRTVKCSDDENEIS